MSIANANFHQVRHMYKVRRLNRALLTFRPHFF